MVGPPLAGQAGVFEPGLEVVRSLAGAAVGEEEVAAGVGLMQMDSWAEGLVREWGEPRALAADRGWAPLGGTGAAWI